MAWPLQFIRPAQSRGPRIEGAEGGDLFVEGNIDGGEALYIDARVIGDVTAGKIFIGAAGVIHGTVQARNVEIAGTVHGAIIASTVQLGAGAVVHGVIEHRGLTIAPGVEFEGQSVQRAVVDEAQLDAWKSEAETEVVKDQARALAG